MGASSSRRGRGLSRCPAAELRWGSSSTGKPMQEQFICSLRMFFVAAEAQTYCRHVVKLRFFSPCFEYQDLFVASRIVCPSESYFSRMVMSEVSVSRRRRSPLARSALPLTCTLTHS
jgi:hypothetical protein